MIADTPEPPYYAVIFTSILRKNISGYQEMALKMEQLARIQPGYLGFESAREDLGISVSYWKDEESIIAWKLNVEHMAAQEMGRAKWYSHYQLRIAKVERAYSNLQGF